MVPFTMSTISWSVPELCASVSFPLLRNISFFLLISDMFMNKVGSVIDVMCATHLDEALCACLSIAENTTVWSNRR